MAKTKKFVQNDNNLAIAYYRYSSSSQNDASIEEQQELVQLYAAEHGYSILKEYADRAMSGQDDNRPNYKLMLSEVTKLRPAVLIMWKNDRLGRDVLQLTYAKRKIREAGCSIEYVAENAPDVSTSQGKFTEAVMDAFAQMWSDSSRENIERGLRYNAKNALSNGQKILGYRTAADKRYEIDPAKAPVVQRIFHDYVDGKPMQQIADELNAQGITTALDRKFTVNGLRSVLKNDRYTGVYKYADIVIPDGMPVIIDRDLFNKAQAMFALNKRTGAGKRSKHVEDEPRYWLTGKLFCGECGSSMQGVSGTSKTGAHHFYYYCKEQRHKRCEKKPVKAAFIEGLVQQLLKELLSDSENLMSLAVDAAAYYKERYVESSYLESLEKELADTQTALKNLVKAIEAGIFSETTQERLQELERRKKALTDAIETEKAKKELSEDEHSIKAYFGKFLYANLDDHEVRDMVLEYFVDKIYLYDDKVILTCRYADADYEVDWEDFQKAKKAASDKVQPSRAQLHKIARLNVGSASLLFCLSLLRQLVVVREAVPGAEQD